MVGGVALANLVHALGKRHRLARRTNRHVRVPQKIPNDCAFVLELGELVCEAERLGLYRCGRMVRNQTSQTLSTQLYADVPSAVKWVKRANRKLRPVADVM